LKRPENVKINHSKVLVLKQKQVIIYLSRLVLVYRSFWPNFVFLFCIWFQVDSICLLQIQIQESCVRVLHFTFYFFFYFIRRNTKVFTELKEQHNCSLVHFINSSRLFCFI